MTYVEFFRERQQARYAVGQGSVQGLLLDLRTDPGEARTLSLGRVPSTRGKAMECPTVATPQRFSRNGRGGLHCLNFSRCQLARSGEGSNPAAGAIARPMMLSPEQRRALAMLATSGHNGATHSPMK